MPRPFARIESLKRLRLQILLPKGPPEFDAADRARAAIRGGADAIQLREKSAGADEFLEEAKEIRRACDESGALFIVNDRVEAVLPSRADGVHLGQEDTPPQEARRILGDEAIIGVSCHSVEEALRAEEAGADIISIGCIFPSPTKPDLVPCGPGLIEEVARRVRIPLMAIGGIRPENIREVFEAGARAAAVSSAAISAPDLESAVQRLRKGIPSR